MDQACPVREELRHVTKKPRLRPLAELVDQCLAPVLAKQGFAASDVIVAWPEIVGERLAAFCEPVKMQWPRRPPGLQYDAPQEPATLVVRVEGAFAIELQHLAPIIVERVNARYGWRCVSRLALRQGPVGREREQKRAIPLPDGAQVAEAAERVGPVADDGLREALVRLGAGIMARRGG
jgi:hypothetical protein